MKYLFTKKKIADECGNKNGTSGDDKMGGGMTRVSYIIALSLAAVALSAMGLVSFADTAREFEDKYQKWADWREENSDSSVLTRCREYKELIAMGFPALPYALDKMSAGDFYMKSVVSDISQKWFPRTEYPRGYWRGDKGVCQLYPEWWSAERFLTPQQFEKIFRQWQEAEKSGDAKAAREELRAIQSLGLPVLPHLMDKLEAYPGWAVEMFSVLVGRKSAAPAECRRFWEQNKAQYTLPGQEEGERRWASLWVSPEERARQLEKAFVFPEKRSVAIAVNECLSMTNQTKTVMGERHIINWWQMFTQGAFTIHVAPDGWGACGYGKILVCKDYAGAKRKAIEEHIKNDILYRCKPPSEIIAHSVVDQKDVGDFSIKWSSEKDCVVFVRDCMVVVVYMHDDSDTHPFAKALDEYMLKYTEK